MFAFSTDTCVGMHTPYSKEVWCFLPVSVAVLTLLCRLVVFPTQLLGGKQPRKSALQLLIPQPVRG